MAPKAFILIETGVGKTREVSSALSDLEGVASVDAVTGPYDIVAVIKAPDLASVGEMITSTVHTIDGIVRTVTCLSVSDPT